MGMLAPAHPLDLIYGTRRKVADPDEMPDIIEFVTSPKYLNRPYLYPRQATLLKMIFLEVDLLTQYDYDVIGEWSTGFKIPDIPVASLDPEADAFVRYIGDWGVTPDVIERMKFLNARGYRWFRTVLAVLGRRSGKGYIGALAGAYVLWYFMMLFDPREYFGIDRDKRLAAQVFAGKKMQARDNQWRDIVNVILGSTCFRKYISTPLTESLTIYSPSDLLGSRNAETLMDTATFEIVPKEATTMAARGPASFMQYYDEMAHMVSTTGGSDSAEKVYESATPALDQFKESAFIYAGSSPWTMTGKYYELCQQALMLDADTNEAIYPDSLIIQLESWAIYEDWERTLIYFPARPAILKHHPYRGDVEYPDIPFTRLKGAIQEYDDRMRRLERANPDTFRVERRCLDPDTRVLTADLAWVRIEDLAAGDRLVAVDEHPPGDGTQRRMRTAEVVAKWDSVSDAYRVTFEDGSSVVCSGTHRWLSTTPSDPGSYRWRSLYRPGGSPGPKRSIKIGDSIAFMVEPWEEDCSREAGYLAGVYDGEGTAIGYPRREFRVSFVQNPGEVLDATLGYLRDKGFTPRYMPVEGKRAQAHVIQGLPEVLRFVGQIGGHKIRRQAIPAMWEGRGLGRINGRSGCKVVASIDPLGERRLVDIETTTGTFIAEGLISHNSKWATAMDSYFPEQHVRRMFAPFSTDPENIEPRRLPMQTKGSPTIDYIAHGDPGKTGSNFGFAVAHREYVAGQEMPHVVFDYVKAWCAADFPNGEMDYEVIEKEIMQVIDDFLLTQLTFDQWNSLGMIQRLAKHARRNFKVTNVFERPATAASNWKTAETMKTALSLDLVHSPIHELLELECLFLRKLPGDKVDHPSSGPVTTKDVYDAASIVIHELVGVDVASYMGEQLSALSVVPGLPGPNSPEGNEVANRFSQFSNERRQALRQGNPARPIPSRGQQPVRRRSR